MTLDRRHLLAGTALALATPFSIAQAFSDKQMQLVVPFAPGGAADIIGRGIAERLSETYGRTVIVENRPGAGSNTGLAGVAKSPADAAIFALASLAVAVNPSLVKAMPFDPITELAPLCLALETPNVVIVPPQSAIRTIPDLIAAARAKPGTISYASAGNGSSLHLAAELFAQQAGVSLNHIPYRGSNPALADLLAGRVDVMFDNASTALPQVAGGTARAIGVTSAKRIAALPDVPSLREQGLKDYELMNWWAFFAPASMPPAVAARLSGDLQAALRHPKLQQAVQAISGEIVNGPPDVLARHLAAETARWRAIILKAGIQPG